MRFLVLIPFVIWCAAALAQRKPPSRVVRDSVVEILYTDGTRRKMVWVNDSTVMLVIADLKGRPFSKAYVDPEFAERQRRIYFIIKIEE